MAKSVVNLQRHDPYKNFKFRITVDGKVVAAVNDASGLGPVPGSSKKKASKIPGLQKFGNITLKRGVVGDTKFFDWMNEIINKPGDEAKNLRKNMILEFCNESGEVMASYRVINGWITKLESVDMNAKGNEVAIETIELSYEGLEQLKS